MAEETKSPTAATDVPEREPGCLVGVEWTKKGTIDLTDDEQVAVRALLTKLSQRDQAPRREEIIRIWEKRLFDRGLQHILPMANGGWVLPNQGSGYGYGEEQSKSMYETNIYNPYSQIIISALTREVPTVRFRSKKPNDDAGITAAQSAECLKEKIVRDNKMLDLMADLARYLCLDGRVVTHTFYMKDGQRFGYKPEPDEAVPEDEDAVSEKEMQAGEAGVTGAVETQANKPPESEESNQTGEEEIPAAKEPNGREVIEVGGALEWKLPIRKNCLAECGYAIRSKEIDTHEARARFPDVAEKITPRSGGPGGDDLDRLARVNVDQGMMNSFNTQDSQANDVTWIRAWLRPWQLLELNQENRDSVISKAPEGLYVNFCGDTFCEARDQSMDDCLSLTHALPGDGMHRPGLLDWLLPIQKVLNNWLELANDYFVRGVPATFMDNEIFNVEALRDQVNQVGERHPFQNPGTGAAMEAYVWQEKPPEFPEQLMAFIQDFKGDLAQLLTGAFPALYGGDTTPTDSPVGTTIIQRDQALGRVGIPWRAIKEGMAKTMLQAVQCLAQNHDDPISVIGKVSVMVEMADLKGDMFAYPDVDESFPETATQKVNRLIKLSQDAVTDPTVGKILEDPDNLEIMVEANGMNGMYVEQIESRNKQLGEIEMMLRTGPIPNPAIAQINQQIATLTSAAQKVVAGNPVLAAQNPQAAQAVQAQIQQLQQQAAQLPPEVSSEPIDVECDNHDIEGMTGMKFINSPRGRAMKHGTPEEQTSFTNIRMHTLAHVKAAADQKAAQTPPVVAKPPSISANVKDLPPEAAAQALAKAGIQENPQNVATERATKLAAEHPKEAVPVVQ